MKLWIDDVRPAPHGYHWLQSTNAALRFIRKNHDQIEEIWLDHDAGVFASDGGDFIEILKEMERLAHHPRWKVPYKASFMKYKFGLHSANPVGVANMRAIIEKNGWEEIR